MFFKKKQSPFKYLRFSFKAKRQKKIHSFEKKLLTPTGGTKIIVNRLRGVIGRIELNAIFRIS